MEGRYETDCVSVIDYGVVSFEEFPVGVVYEDQNSSSSF